MHRYILTHTLSRALLSGFSLLLAAQSHLSSAPLTLNEALNLARESNPELQARLHQADAAEARIGTAGTLPDPTAKFTYFGESVETRTGPQEAIYSISQTVPWLPKLQTQKAFARQNAETVTQNYEAGRLHIDEALTEAYTEAVFYKEAAALMETNIHWIEDSLEIVDQQVRDGASLNSLLRLEVEMERVRDQLDQYSTQSITHRTRLAALLGIEANELIELADIPMPQSEVLNAFTLQQDMLQNNPELIALRSRLESAGTQTKLSRLKRYPDFTFGLNYIQVGDNGSTARDAGRDPWNLTVAVNLPIWEGRNRAAIRSSQADERAISEIYRNRLTQLKAELTATLATHADNSRRMQRYKDTLIPLAQQALENSEAAYESGQVSALEVIESERALLQLQLMYWRTRADIVQADARIARLTSTTINF